MGGILEHVWRGEGSLFMIFPGGGAIEWREGKRREEHRTGGKKFGNVQSVQKVRWLRGNGVLSWSATWNGVTSAVTSGTHMTQKRSNSDVKPILAASSRRGAEKVFCQHTCFVKRRQNVNCTKPLLCSSAKRTAGVQLIIFVHTKELPTCLSQMLDLTLSVCFESLKLQPSAQLCKIIIN